MKRVFFPFILLVSISSCYQAPVIEDFDKDAWIAEPENCSGYRLAVAEEIMVSKDKQNKLLTRNQNEIKNLFGEPDKHQLFNRNQKFFFYKLDCEQRKELSIRFDALGRVKELQIIEVQ